MKKDTSYACLRLALPVRINMNLILPSCSGLMVKAYTRCVVDAAGGIVFSSGKSSVGGGKEMVPPEKRGRTGICAFT